jgi:hypothetical protein
VTVSVAKNVKRTFLLTRACSALYIHGAMNQFPASPEIKLTRRLPEGVGDRESIREARRVGI